jgi:hypothetical protein
MAGELNGFEVNLVGLGGSPFPLSVSCERDPVSDIWTFRAVAVRLRDVADLVIAACRPFVVIYDVAHYEMLPDQTRMLDLDAVATDRAVPHRALDVNWAAYGRSRADGRRELIVMATSALPQLVDDLPMYDFSLLSVDEDPGDEEIERMILEAKTSDRPALAVIPDTDFALDMHDDCYLEAQGRSRTQLLGFGGRALALLVAAIAKREGLETGVTDPPPVICDALLAGEPGWTADQARVSQTDARITVPLARANWRLGDALPHATDATACYDVATQAWTWS